MLSLGSVRIFVHRKPMEMRCGFERLSLVVEEEYPGTLWEAAYFVFLNERRTLMKVLYWDQDGLAIWAKRLETGTFGWCIHVHRGDSAALRVQPARNQMWSVVAPRPNLMGLSIV